MMAAIDENCWTDQAVLAIMSTQQTPSMRLYPPQSPARAKVDKRYPPYRTRPDSVPNLRFGTEHFCRRVSFAG
jgi:hypothetical protein